MNQQQIAFSHDRLARAIFRLPARDAEPARNFVDDHETDVVTGVRVRRPRIAQADDHAKVAYVALLSGGGVAAVSAPTTSGVVWTVSGAATSSARGASTATIVWSGGVCKRSPSPSTSSLALM